MKKFILSACVIIGFLAIYITIYNLTYNYTNNKEKLEVLSTTDSTATFYISEKNYAINMKNRVLKLTDSLENKGSFTNNGHSIAYNYYLQDSARANIVVSHGYTERKEKYKELAYYFLKMGYQVFIHDHYSHGQSSRFT
nr:alpha/beta hydrolase [Paludibacter sp.]